MSKTLIGALWVFLCLGFFFCTSTQACTSPENGSLLWKISGNGLEKPSYLFGTIHLIYPEDLQISEKINRAFAKSEKLVCELDFSDPVLLQAMQQQMIYTDGTTARDYLSEKEYQLVNDFFRDSLGMSLEQMQAVKPFFLASFPIPKMLGCQPASWEMRLVEMAKAKAMQIGALETVQQQMHLVEQYPLEDYRKILLETIEKYDEMKVMFDQIMTLYQREDLEALQKVVPAIMSQDYQEFEALFITERNHNWIPLMEKMASEKSCFFAVGAGHLPGEEGVIALLQKAGYEVEAVF